MSENGNFPQSAGRHLLDASLLLDPQNNRIDNAIYHAGYVVECAFKTLLEQYMGRSGAAKYGHRLVEMQGEALDRLRMMYPEADLRLPTSRTTGTVLDQDHPVRRYFKSGMWSRQEAEAAVQCAKEIYEEIIIGLVLDGKLSGEELEA